MPIPTTEPVRHFVRAGAGAGKTWNLTRQVIGRAMAFHEKEGRWPKTVVTTFTRKATQELKERLLTYCLQEAPEALNYVQSSSQLHITTMHGLFDTFLRRYGAAIGLPNQFTIIDALEGVRLRKKVLKKIFNESSELASVLNRYDFRRILEILNSYEELPLSNEALMPNAHDLEAYALLLASEWAEDLTNFIEEASDHVDGEKWSLYFSYLNDLSAVLGSQSWNKLREDLGKVLGREKKPRKSKSTPGLPEFLDKKHKLIVVQLKKFMDAEEFDPNLWSKSEEEFSLFKKLSKKYRIDLVREKLKEGQLEVNDLENFSSELIRSVPKASESFYLDWDDWFIDEFQDTSPGQLELLEAMVRDKPCYIVGDPQQSIYLFRGARSEVFFDKEKRVRESQGHIDFLSTNYRSEKPLMSFFNQLFAQMDKQFSPMESADNSESLEPIAHISVALDSESELAQMSHQIAKLLDSGVSPKNISVLTRTNGQLEKVLSYLRNLGFPVISHSSSSYYSRREILDAMSVLKFLLNPWDDINLIALMRSPWVPLEDDQIVKVIGESTESYWQNFRSYFKENSDFEVGEWLLKALQSKMDMGVAWVFRKLLISLGFFEYTHRIDSTGRREANLWKLVNLIEKGSREPGVAILDLVERGNIVLDLDSIGDNIDASSSVEPDKINLMTVHSSKGLQFEYIFLPFMNKRPQRTSHFNFCFDEQKKLWSFRVPLGENNQFIGSPLEKYMVREIGKRENQEFLRVFYVALTRAKKKVFMSWFHKVESSSWAELVGGALDTTVGEHKKPQFSYQVHEAKELEGQPYLQKEDKIVVRPAASTFRERYYLEVEKKTKAVTGQVDLDKETQSKEFWQSQQKRWQGVVLHRLFEMLKYSEPSVVQTMLEKWLGDKKETSLSAFNYVLDLQEPPLMKLIENGEVEWFFQAEIEGKVLEGRIDLWSLYNDELWIVDYKTGSSWSQDKAFKQLENYHKALTQYLGNIQKVHLCLIYAFKEKVIVKSL